MQDQHDIKLLSYLTLSKLADVAPGAVMHKMEAIAEPLKVSMWHSRRMIGERRALFSK